MIACVPAAGSAVAGRQCWCCRYDSGLPRPRVQVAQVLLRELPTLATLCTLSPMPGFAGWLDMRISRGLQVRVAIAF